MAIEDAVVPNSSSNADGPLSASMRSDIDQLTRAVVRARSGDLRASMPTVASPELSELAMALAGFVDDVAGELRAISEVVEGIRTHTGSLTGVGSRMTRSADDTSNLSGNVSGGAKDVHGSIQAVSMGAEQMTVSIVEISRNAARAADVARTAVGAASDADRAIKELGASSEQIGKVIRTITSIAQQTNLLALNAHIEAARAGEAGKGFAVVANEVKELAKETASATEDIGGKIEAIQGTAMGVVDAISRINAIIEQISDSQSAIASAVEEQSVVTSEISCSVAIAARGSEEIAHSLGEVSQSADATVTGVSEAREIAIQLSALTTRATDLLQKFRV